MAKIKSALSKVVAQQMGLLEGQLRAYALTKLVEYGNRLKDTCPPPAETLLLLRNVDSIQRTITKYQTQSRKYNSLIQKLDKVIQTTTTAITVLRVLPIPTAVAGVGVPIGLTNRYSEKLIQLSEFSEALNNDKNAILAILKSSSVEISPIQSRLNQIKSQLDNCIRNTSDPSIQVLNTQIQQSNNQQVMEGDDLYTLSNGREVKIIVRTIEDFSYPVNRRVAEARNLNEVVLLTGEPSFSSDKQVLIEELLFRLENQLV
jgi:hypothetical protein